MQSNFRLELAESNKQIGSVASIASVINKIESVSYDSNHSCSFMGKKKKDISINICNHQVAI
jgi:hypothetical protein